MVNGLCNSLCMEALTHCLNQIVHKKDPETWKTSKTAMIPKTDKPKVKEHRTALTCSGYKMLMSLVKEKLLNI